MTCITLTHRQRLDTAAEDGCAVRAFNFDAMEYVPAIREAAGVTDAPLP